MSADQKPNVRICFTKRSTWLIEMRSWSLQDLSNDKANRVATILTERFLRLNASANLTTREKFCRLDLPSEDRNDLRLKGHLHLSIEASETFSHFVPFGKIFPPIRTLRMRIILGLVLVVCWRGSEKVKGWRFFVGAGHGLV